jgi:amidase
MTDELWSWTASAAARAIASGSVSSVEVVTACLSRIEQVNGELNAVVVLDADESLAAARAADRAVVGGQPLGPLHGVPVAVKINTDQKGHATSDGVVAFAENLSDVDSPSVANLRQAGAVLTGRTNSPAFSYRWFADNDLHGRTNNPWDRERTPGGSSGGAASAVASGMVPLAHGNDIGGSVRYPAYACGIAGIRPTVGRIPSTFGPRDQDLSLSGQSMLAQGPLARSVEDLRLAVDAMSGFDPRDPFSVPLASIASTPGPRRPVKAGIVRSSSIATPQPAVADAVEAAATMLEGAGYVVEEVELPMVEEAYRLWYLLCMEEFGQLMPLVEQVGDEGMQLAAQTYYAAAKEWWGEKPDRDTYMAGYARRGTLMAQLQSLMEEYPVVVLPVSSEQAFEHDADVVSIERGLEVVQAQWSMMGVPLLSFPAASVPTGIANGLPTGVQILGQRFGERAILDAAEVIECCAGVLTPIEPR